MRSHDHIACQQHGRQAAQPGEHPALHPEKRPGFPYTRSASSPSTSGTRSRGGSMSPQPSLWASFSWCQAAQPGEHPALHPEKRPGFPNGADPEAGLELARRAPVACFSRFPPRSVSTTPTWSAVRSTPTAMSTKSGGKAGPGKFFPKGGLPFDKKSVMLFIKSL